MDILDNVIQHCIPPEWKGVNSSAVKREDYLNNRYQLFDLSTDESEYLKEIDAFREGNLVERVTQLQRIQNPFQLGRLLLREEQKRNRNEVVVEKKFYHPIVNQDQLTTALEYNMDVRRYESAGYGQIYDRNPRFYRTPKEAFEAIFNCQYILVCLLLSKSYEGDLIYRMNDTEYMPVYVVRLV